MAEAATTLLLEKLKEVFTSYQGVIAGAEHELRQLVNELIYFKAFLKESAKMKEKPYILEEMKKRIKEVVYEVEDTIDICLTSAIAAKEKKPSRSFLRIRTRLKPSSSVLKHFDLAAEVRSLREEKVLPAFKDIRIQFATLKLNDGSGSFDDTETSKVRRVSKVRRDKPIRQSRIVGFDEEEQTIIGYLMQETEGLDVIPIIGTPGLGKTTLAYKIYQNEDVCFHFPIRIWVYFSQVFNSRDVFLQILRKFTPSQEISKLNDGELAQTARACLVKEKFLLVLDDVWSVDAWEEIKGILPLGNTKSKVLITSREDMLGKASLTLRTQPYKLKLLTAQESWTLLKWEVFGNDKDYPDELKSIGKHIANKCNGLPLTIVVIGGILVDYQRYKNSMAVTMNEWEMVSKNMSGALGGVQLINDVVSLSYDRLPEHLSDCFVYMGVFPDNYEIPVKMLLGFWIAEGYIQSMAGRSLEVVAEDYLNDLISRNLVKADERNHMGKVKTCRVSDIIRAWCITKSKEENIFQEIHKYNTTGALELSVSELQKSHRLSIHSELHNFLSGEPVGPHVRSFLCFYEKPIELSPTDISAIQNGFPKLRILESMSVKFNQFPARITKLIYLRYLTLLIEDLPILPEEISQLWNLESLVVETRTRTITMKANLWRMIRMRHLKTKAAIVLDNTWDGEAGLSLQTLDRLSPDSCTEALYKKAKNLQTLGISGKLANIFETKILAKMQYLKKLKLVNSLRYEQTADDRLYRLPRWYCFPPHLKSLTLKNTFLDWEDMSVLAMIESLESLKLKDNAFVGLSWNVSGYQFPNLLLLLIVNADLVVWEAATDAFPTLKFVVLKNCGNLAEIPQCVGTHLEKLEIEGLRSSAVQSAMAIGETQRGKFAGPFILNIGCL